MKFNLAKRKIVNQKPAHPVFRLHSLFLHPSENPVSTADGKTTETELALVEGMSLDRGFISPYFVTQPKDQLVWPIFLSMREKREISVNCFINGLMPAISNFFLVLARPS